MAVQCLTHMLAPAGFVHTEIVDVKNLPVAEDGIVGGGLENAEGITKNGAVFFGNENGSQGILQ